MLALEEEEVPVPVVVAVPELLLEELLVVLPEAPLVPLPVAESVAGLVAVTAPAVPVALLVVVPAAWGGSC